MKTIKLRDVKSRRLHSESEERSYDATYRKPHKFLNMTQ